MDESSSPGSLRKLCGSLRQDLLASIVVFLVALPLCMGIAIASGVPPERAAAAGLMTGIVGGVVVGLIGGSPVLVSGPTASLSVILVELVNKWSWERIGIIVLLAGAIQISAGLFKWGKWFRAVSPAITYGMLAGIGVLIFASQFHIMLDDTPKGSPVANLLSLPEAVWKGIVPSETAAHHNAARIGLLTIAVIVLWKPFAPKRLKAIPPALAAVACATAVTAFFELPIKQVVVPANLLATLQLPTIAGLDSPAQWSSLLMAALSLAIIASAETLLSATAVDKMHSGRRTCYDRELMAQGVGNMLCGTIGALPMTGVIVRSAANIEAGARTRLAAITHGLWLLGVVCLCPFLLRWIPTASFAALLVYTGYKLVNPQVVRTLARYGKGEVLIYAATMTAIVLTDLLSGVLIGVGLTVVKQICSLGRLVVRREDDPATGSTTLHLEGTALFFRLPDLAAALEAVPTTNELRIRSDQLRYVDHACLDLLTSFAEQHSARGGKVIADWTGVNACFNRYCERTESPIEVQPKVNVEQPSSVTARRRRQRPRMVV